MEFIYEWNFNGDIILKKYYKEKFSETKSI